MARLQIADLSAVTEAVYQKEFQALHPLLRKEAQLRGQLSRLDAQVSQVRSESHQAEGFHVTGGDVLWHGWESATRRQLNLELAQLRSQKLEAMDRLRKAFGQKQAVETLSAEEQNLKRMKLQKVRMAQGINDNPNR